MPGDRIALTQGAGDGHRSADTRLAWLCALASLGVTAGVLWHFHDRSWWPPDEGVYAYVAQRILAGDVLNGNLQDLHAGYVNFLHAAAMWLFGEDLRSLRYPLVALTLLQAAFAFRLLQVGHGAVYAAIGAVVGGSLTFVQFLNPSANWYVLFCAFATAAVLAEARGGGSRRDLAIGGLLAIAFLLRQLSGVILAVGVLTWLLQEPTTERQSQTPRLARGLLCLMALGVSYYLWRKASVDGLVLLGIWPLAVIAIAAIRTRMGDRCLIHMVARMALGAAAVAAPLVIYHLTHGTLTSWIGDTIGAALHLTQLDFIDNARYWHVAVLAIGNLLQAAGPVAVANSIFWLALLAAPMILGTHLVSAAWRGRTEPFRNPLPTIAVCYGLCSTHYEIPIYLLFSSGLTLLALMQVLGGGVLRRIGVGAAAVAAVIVGLAFQAGQPLSRGLDGIVAGATQPLDAPGGLPMASLAIEESDRQLYTAILATIAAHSDPQDAILALPVNPELYFLSQRRAIFRFNSSAIGIRDQAGAAAALLLLAESKPPIVVHNRADKYNNWASAALMDEVRRRYVLSEQTGPFDVYVLPARSGVLDAPARPQPGPDG